VTGWAGPGQSPAGREPLGLADSLAVILLPWLDPHAQADSPCMKEVEAQ
jgi:hypothetical protein